MNENVTTNKLGTLPVNKLMLQMGIPMIVSMMLQAFYNIVDSAFVSNMPENGELALNALTLAFPIQVLMVAVCIGTGVGTNALLSKTLGRGDKEGVAKVAGNGIFLSIVISVIFIIFAFTGVEAYIDTQTTNPEIREMAILYLKICCGIPIGIVFFSTFEKLLQATGLSIYSTTAQIVGAVLNIILDPILIYGLLGLPKMGVAGAAYATVIGQIGSFVVALFFHLRKNKDVKNGIKYLKPSARIIKAIYAIGLPAIIAQALMSFMTYGLNVILVRASENLVTAYGLFYKIQQFVLFAAFGLRDAITPIVSFNHGMGDRKRINDGIKYGLIYTTVIMVVGLIVLEAFAKPFSSIFGLSGETQGMCIDAMRIIAVSFIFAGANIVFQGVFQALDGGLESLIISLCRQLIFVLPVIYLLTSFVISDISKSWIIWTAFPFAEIISLIIAVFLMKRINKKILIH